MKTFSQQLNAYLSSKNCKTLHTTLAQLMQDKMDIAFPYINNLRQAKSAEVAKIYYDCQKHWEIVIKFEGYSDFYPDNIIQDLINRLNNI